MANTIEIIIKATDKTSEVIAKIESKVAGTSKTLAGGFNGIGGAIDKVVGKLGGIDKIADKMGNVGKKMSIGVTLPLLAIGTAAVKAASDLGETANKVDVLFGNESKAIKDFASTADKALGQSKKTAMDAASTFGIFGKSAGLAGKDLSNFAIQNTKLASDMASFFNTSPEDAITAIGAAFRGETEPIRRYGVLLDDASMRQEALRLGLIATTTDALTPQQKVLAAQALILKQTGAAQGDFARTSTGLANATRITNAELQNTLATLGENLLPIVNEGVVTINRLLEAFNALTPEQQKLVVGFGAVAAAIGPVMTVGSKLVGVVQLIDKGIDKLGASAGPLALIVAGLVVIVTYLNQVGDAAKKSNDELIKMSRSGDLFQQAAASTELLLHGQDRLKAALDGVNKELQHSGRTYDDYRSSLQATAKAAGYQIDAEGNLYRMVRDGLFQKKEVIATNYLLTDSQYANVQATDAAAQAAANQAFNQSLLNNAMLGAVPAQQGAAAATDGMTAALAGQAQVAAATDKVVTDSLKDRADAYNANIKRLAELRAAIGETINANANLAQSLANATAEQVKQQLATVAIEGLKKAYDARTLSAEEYEKAVMAVQLRYGLATPASIAMAEAQGKLTEQFVSGKLPLEDYIAATGRIPKVAADGIVSTQELITLGLRPLAGEFINAKKTVDDFLASLAALPPGTTRVVTPNLPRNPNQPGGYQTGGDFIVPSGFPRDTYKIGVTSGERVQITPAGRGASQGVSIGAVTINVGGSNASAQEIQQAVYQGIKEVFDGTQIGAA